MKTAKPKRVRSSAGLGCQPLPGDVVKYETEWIVQCEGADKCWYDFALTPAPGNARAKLEECRKYRPANYRLVMRETRDELLAS